MHRLSLISRRVKQRPRHQGTKALCLQIFISNSLLRCSYYNINNNSFNYSTQSYCLTINSLLTPLIVLSPIDSILAIHLPHLPRVSSYHYSRCLAAMTLKIHCHLFPARRTSPHDQRVAFNSTTPLHPLMGSILTQPTLSTTPSAPTPTALSILMIPQSNAQCPRT